MRLDQYVAQYWPEHSRSTWQKYISQGLVRVNTVVTTTGSYQLGEDDIVTIDELPSTRDNQLSLPVLYEDDHVVVINKPSGVLTHAKGTTCDEFTVADFVREKMTESESSNRPGIIHRLDRDTSGVIIAAKDPETKHQLQKQFQDRKAKKTYVAIICGTPKHLEANIDLPIGRNPAKPSCFRVDPKGKEAQTHYNVIRSNGQLSVVMLKPYTGRTHQLRVHMAYLGTPILGDTFYGGKRSPIGRLCLHAKELEITIPPSLRKTFTADMPDDFRKLVNDIV